MGSRPRWNGHSAVASHEHFPAFRTRFPRWLSEDWRGTLSPQAPVPLPDARRKAHARAIAGMGSESLLLSEPHSHQRLDDFGALGGPGISPWMAEANSGS